MKENRKTKMIRTTSSQLETRASPDNSQMYIEGYFAVFNQETELWPGAYEELSSGAFDCFLSAEGEELIDVKALTDHETMYVLGRTTSESLELRVDEKGLWGRITINPEDSDATNLYARVKRGDVNQCSFGFDIEEEIEEYRDDGTIKWTIIRVRLYEVSVCTFPAYKNTGVQARKQQAETIKLRSLQVRKRNLKERLSHGAKAVNA